VENFALAVVTVCHQNFDNNFRRATSEIRLQDGQSTFSRNSVDIKDIMKKDNIIY